MNKQEVIKAYLWVRENNESIPSEILDLMKNSAIATLEDGLEDIKEEQVEIWTEVFILFKDNMLIPEKDRKYTFEQYLEIMFKNYNISKIWRGK